MRVAGLAAAVLLVVCLGAVVIAMTGGPKAPFTQWAAPQSQAPAPAGNQGQRRVMHRILLAGTKPIPAEAI